MERAGEGPCAYVTVHLHNAAANCQCGRFGENKICTVIPGNGKRGERGSNDKGVLKRPKGNANDDDNDDVGSNDYIGEHMAHACSASAPVRGCEIGLGESRDLRDHADE